MTRPIGERFVVQDPLIRYACEAGWAYLPPDEALRLCRGETSNMFDSLLQNLITGRIRGSDAAPTEVPA